MIQFRWRLLIVTIIWFVLLVIIGINLWWGGYLKSIAWNYNANSTDSVITGHNIETTTCKCGKHCSRTCYYGYINIAWVVDNATYTDKDLQVYSSYQYEENVRNDLNTYYPINGTIPIWYQIHDPADYDFHLKRDQDYYIAFFAMVTISLLVLVIWGGIEIIHLCKKHDVIGDIEMAVRPKFMSLRFWTKN